MERARTVSIRTVLQLYEGAVAHCFLRRLCFLNLTPRLQDPKEANENELHSSTLKKIELI